MKKTKLPFKTKDIDEENYRIDFVMSTDDVDRHGESVAQNWETENFVKNPVFLNSHQYHDAAETIGKVVDITQNENSLEGVVEFAVEENPKAKIIYDLYTGGFLNAVSVGFNEMKVEDGIANELLELSAVSVPANAQALAKQKGIEVDELDKELEEEDLIEEDENEQNSFKKKEGRTLSQENINLLMEAIDKEYESIECLVEVLEKAGAIDNSELKNPADSYDDDKEDKDKEDKDEHEDKNEEKSVEEEEDKDEDKEENEDEVIKALNEIHKEVSGTHEDNVDIKKKNIHKQLREFKQDLLSEDK